MKVLATLAVAAVTLAACSNSAQPASGHHGGGTASGAASAVVTIRGTSSLRFQPSVVSVRAKTAQVSFVDASSYPHNLRVPALHFTSKTVNGGIGGANSTRFTLHFPHPGRYSFFCTYHDSAGMRGAFIVQ